MVGFAANSAFWLALAFLMGAQAYGELMTVQAAVLLVVSGATFRTHDLYFNLLAQHGQPHQRAYAIARGSELLAAAAATIVVCAGAAVLLLPEQRFDAFAIACSYALLAALGASQGAAIAELRHAHRGDIIARTDAVAAVMWGAAGVAAVFLERVNPLLPLLLGAAPTFGRSVLLARAARGLARPGVPLERIARGEVREVAGFLLGAQLTNFLKNGAVSIETVILAAFAPAPMVAMYRVARGVLGIAVAALNVAYQRVYPVLARAASAAEFRSAITGLERRSLAICLITYPLSAFTALLYAWMKHDVGIAALQLLTLGTFLASLPSALQQGAFAVLSLRGLHRAANTAYVLWFVVLGAGSALLLLYPRIEVFMAALILAGAARLAYLKHRARAAQSARMPASPPQPQSGATDGDLTEREPSLVSPGATTRLPGED